MSKHPIQPIEDDGKGVIRFKENAIVRKLADAYGLNDVARDCCDATRDDWDQFYQLIGYSVSGAPISEACREIIDAMERDRTDQRDAELIVLRAKLENVRDGIRAGVAELFSMHPDDLGGE